MSEQVTAVRNGGLGIGTIIFIVLLILKLTHAAEISWFLVFLPLIISYGLGILIVIIMLLTAFIYDL